MPMDVPLPSPPAPSRGTCARRRSTTGWRTTLGLDETPDTVVIATPADPLRVRRIPSGHRIASSMSTLLRVSRIFPMLRRETGGGAVYLDRQPALRPVDHVRQLRRCRLGSSSGSSCSRSRSSRPTVSSVSKPEFRPVNDVHVDGQEDRQGPARRRSAMPRSLVGNFILDFDNDVMAHVLRAPSDAVPGAGRGEASGCYMTSMRRELGVIGPASRQSSTEVYRREV